MKLQIGLASLLALIGSCPAFLNAEPPVEMAESASLDWQTNYETAKAQAKTDAKPLLLYFTGSDWCVWCQKMDQEVFSTPELAKALGQKLIFVKIDFPQKSKLDVKLKEQNDKLAEEYHVQAFPTIILLDQNGKVIKTFHYEGDGATAFATRVDEALKAYSK